VQLSEIGKYADELLQNITIHNPYCKIPLSIIMPNHIHAIVLIDGAKTPISRNNAENKNKKMQEIANLKGWLSVAIGGFKSAVTKFATEKNIHFAWQPRFNDRIIRNQDEVNRIAKYIENNVLNWDTDELNKQQMPYLIRAESEP
jgi:REP element-mobilizing transposase RayT